MYEIAFIHTIGIINCFHISLGKKRYFATFNSNIAFVLLEVGMKF